MNMNRDIIKQEKRGFRIQKEITLTLSSLFKRKIEDTKQNNQLIKVAIDTPIITLSPEPARKIFIKTRFKIRKIIARTNIQIENFLNLFLAEKEVRARSVPIMHGITNARILRGIAAGR